MKKTKRVAECPSLMKQWDFEKNREFDPNLLTIHSHAVVWWKCKKCGYEWSAMIKNRTALEGRCPKCERKTPVYTKFVSDVPELMRLWGDNPDINPKDTPVSSKAQVNWKCPKCGYKWHSSVWNRTVTEGRCPKCERGHPKDTQYVSDIPELMRLWGDNPGINPEKISIYSEIRVNWKCRKCGYTWQSTVSARTTSKRKCPKCERKHPDRVKYVSDVPELMRLWGDNPDIKPEDTPVFSKGRVNWKCPKCDYEWKASAKTVVKSDNPCPVCSNRIATKEFNALTEFPDLLKYYDFEYPDNPSLETLLPSSKDPVHWYCPDCEYRWVQPVKERIRRHRGKHRVAKCPVCAGVAVAGVNATFAADYPEIAKEWDYEKNETTPQGITPTSTNHYWWICPEGHHYALSPAERVKYLEAGETACPYCDDRRVLPGLNSFKAKHPDLMKEWDEVNNFLLTDADAVSDASIKLAYWNCPEGHTYPMRYQRRVMFAYRGITACPYCKGLNNKKMHTYRFNMRNKDD